GIRVDTGFIEGDTVTPHYDPMLAKLIVSGPDRRAAFERLREALGSFEIAGVTTNIAFLSRLVGHKDVLAGEMDTGLIERELDTLVTGAIAPGPQELAAAIAAVVSEEERALSSASPWERAGGWTMTGSRRRRFEFTSGDTTYEATLHYGAASSNRMIEINGFGHAFRYHLNEGQIDVFLDGRKERASVLRDGRDLRIANTRGTFRLHWRDPYAIEGNATASAGRFVAPMPGAVTRILIEPGASVTKGDPVLVIEAMKMEHTLKAPVTGKLTSLACTIGGFVQEGTVL
ncbi:hypothetical protein Angca_004637, partial [Angiostrongylus cantonensis]